MLHHLQRSKHTHTHSYMIKRRVWGEESHWGPRGERKTTNTPWLDLNDITGWSRNRCDDTVGKKQQKKTLTHTHSSSWHSVTHQITLLLLPSHFLSKTHTHIVEGRSMKARSPFSFRAACQHTAKQSALYQSKHQAHRMWKHTLCERESRVTLGLDSRLLFKKKKTDLY